MEAFNAETSQSRALSSRFLLNPVPDMAWTLSYYFKQSPCSRIPLTVKRGAVRLSD
jgi:hypothetical protein